MIYLDILTNDNDDCLLYVNGASYSDISEYWVDCLKFLAEILADKMQVRISRTEKERKDFPGVLMYYKSPEPVWRKINLDELPYFLSHQTVKWECDGDTLVINPEEATPKDIKLKCLTSGKWSVLVSK